MIALLGASVLALAALQASISAPRDTFRACLKDAGAKAATQKVAADAFEGYLRNACTSELGSLKSAITAFNMKNGMGKKAAADDAEMTVDDYLASPVDNYKFMASQSTPPKP
jgi:hypothetical protein